ncbi:hypothetical protein HA466_0185310 [Hirschfeldia incana]|nr:hypothetical protein HA466_0185310 [Hirschfeldia incana]KAJ0245033.1 hypothetical protein HA466_0185310 [Hirschfeldia incana]KAJ0245034.1 hypothetical protein HA466_0185310 [Hirschfeldia incana]
MSSMRRSSPSRCEICINMSSFVVEAMLMRFWERREMKRLVIASHMVVKDALGSFRDLTNLALLSMMKSGEFLSMITRTIALHQT